jgi:hypothetical protein
MACKFQKVLGCAAGRISKNEHDHCASSIDFGFYTQLYPVEVVLQRNYLYLWRLQLNAALPLFWRLQEALASRGKLLVTPSLTGKTRFGPPDLKPTCSFSEWRLVLLARISGFLRKADFGVSNTTVSRPLPARKGLQLAQKPSFYARLIDSLSLPWHGESSSEPGSVMIRNPAVGNSLEKTRIV